MKMKITTDNKDVILSDTSCFDLTHIFECGQCFRWNKTTDNEYLGIAFGKVLKISKENNGFRFKNTTVEEFNSVWKNYFDLDFDYLAVQKTLSCDAVLKETIKSGFGIRILRRAVRRRHTPFAAGYVGGALLLHPFPKQQYPPHKAYYRAFLPGIRKQNFSSGRYFLFVSERRVACRRHSFGSCIFKSRLSRQIHFRCNK